MADFNVDTVVDILKGRLEELSEIPTTSGNSFAFETVYSFINNILNEVEHKQKFAEIFEPDVNEYAEGLDNITHERDDLLETLSSHKSAPIPF